MIRVSLPVIPEASSTLLGIMELLGTVGVAWQEAVENKPAEPAFDVQLVSENGAATQYNRRWTLQPHSALADVERTDVVFIPSLWINAGETFAGRHEALKQWIARQYRQGAIVCAACTGVMLLADSGVLDGEAATTHWAYEDVMRRHYPRIDLRTGRVLVESGEDGRLVTSGSHATWYDVALHLICRLCGRERAMQTAKFFLLQWHVDGQTPYRAFQDRLAHGDALVRDCQGWLRANLSHPNPVEAVEGRSGLASRTFKRRFKAATGMTVITYVQALRIEQAKSLLESGDAPVDDVSWRIGYEDAAFFRRLFKRLTGLTPSEYRRKFQLPRPDRFPARPAGRSATRAAATRAP